MGWVWWTAPRMKFRKQQDIFGMWDGVACKGKEIKFIQFTTKSNKSGHIKKIKQIKQLYNLSHKGELWLWDSKCNNWEVVNV